MICQWFHFSFFLLSKCYFVIFRLKQVRKSVNIKQSCLVEETEISIKVLLFFSDLSDNPDVSSTANTDRLTSSQQQLAYPAMMGDMGPLPGQTASSIETLLRNIQGLVKVAADNARHQERQISLEKGNLLISYEPYIELYHQKQKALTIYLVRLYFIYNPFKIRRKKKCFNLRCNHK